MTETRRNRSAEAPGSHRGASRLNHVLAPRVTRIASYVIVGGVLVQAGIAGGFLAGHSLTDVHMLIGFPLIVSAFVLMVVGVFGRRIRREPKSVLLTRLGVLVALLITPILGLVAAAGTRDLLMIHIPLAIVSMGLAARLAGVARRGGRQADTT
jgi:hypothetical protein